MKSTIKLAMFSMLLLAGFSCLAQQSQTWSKWTWLMGEWKGEGKGQPGQGEGRFSFKPGLDNKILVRSSHSEYPANGNRPAVIHDDMMVVYQDPAGNPSKAIYFDNEGHTINYSISYADSTIVMVSEKIPGIPIFKLTYTFLDPQTVFTKFEMSQDGEKFVTYIEGKSIRSK